MYCGTLNIVTHGFIWQKLFDNIMNSDWGFIYYSPQTEVKGKVMFSQEFVCPQGCVVKGGVVDTPGPRSRHSPPGPRGKPPSWTQRQTHPHPEADTPPRLRGRHPTSNSRDGHWRGWYASYWNEFLFFFMNTRYHLPAYHQWTWHEHHVVWAWTMYDSLSTQCTPKTSFHETR